MRSVRDVLRRALGGLWKRTVRKRIRYRTYYPYRCRLLRRYGFRATTALISTR
jgi:hypothetical protein